MRYFPPPTWPPPPSWSPPADDWRPPPSWTPRNVIPIAPDGDGYLLPPVPGESPPPALTADEAEEIHKRRVTKMLGMWAREVQRAAHSYYQAACKVAWTDRAIEYMEDWSPTQEDLVVAMEETWVRGYYLIMGAYQMEQWLGAYHKATGEEVTESEAQEERDLLHSLRNTVEHLSDVRLTSTRALKDETNTRWRKWAIDKLPGASLFLGYAPGNHEYVFDHVEVKQLFLMASKYRYVDTPPELLDFEPSDIDYENMRYRDDDDIN